MSALVSLLLSSFWQEIAAGAALLIGGAALYFKGRSDRAKADTIKDFRHAEDIRQRADQARAAAADRDRGDGLRQSDGFKRD